MNLLSKIGLEIVHIDADIKSVATKAATITTAIEKALNSNVAIDLATLVPQGEIVREEVISLCNEAIAGCKALQAIGDGSGIEGRLQRLGTDLTQLWHNNTTHTFSFYCECFEAVYNDLFGK
jgi:hypothetical protein